MRPLTETTPKPLLEVGGRSLIEHHIAALELAGVADIVINLSWLGEQIRERLGDGERHGVNIEYSDEGAEPLETAGGIIRALPMLGDEPFWLVNGDVNCNFVFNNSTLDNGDSGRLVLVANPDHNAAGDFGLDGDRIVNEADRMLTYSGIALLRPAMFSGLPDGKRPLAPLLREHANQQSLAGVFHQGHWCDVGTPERLAALDKQLS